MSDKPFWDGFFSVFHPIPLLTVAEWAEKYRKLSGAGSSERGNWRNSRTPYLVEIMNELSPQSKTKEVAVLKGTQLGFTEAATNWVMYNMHTNPSSFLYLMPTESVALSFSKQRFSPALESCPAIRDKLQVRVGNSLLEKVVPGGYVTLRGANSPAGLASNPFANLICDELDRYPDKVGDEGDPIGIVKRRMSNFPNAKIFYLSSPALKETSKIWPLYEESDQRVYMVKCPHCGELDKSPAAGYFEIKFEQLRWTKKVYDDILLYCPLCGVGIAEHEKTKMLASGKWVAKNPGHWRAGFYISSLYSPLGWCSWIDIAREFEASRSDPEKRQVFENTMLGLPYENTGESIANEYLARRVEMYNAQVPNGVLQLTMAVDVQKTRLEYEVRGWGKGEESWGIEYGRIEGPTTELDSGDNEFPSVWKRLDELRVKGFTREDGYEMRIICTMIDSGGIDTTTDTVYKYTLSRQRMRVFALKGSSNPSKPIYNVPHRKTPNGCALFIVGTYMAKDYIYQILKIDEPGPCYCHFPDNEDTGYNAAYYASLTAERRMVKIHHGYKKIYWVKDKNARNEGLDLFVYNLLAIRHINPNWDALAARYRLTPTKTSAVKSQPSKIRKKKPQGVSLSS